MFHAWGLSEFDTQSLLFDVPSAFLIREVDGPWFMIHEAANAWGSDPMLMRSQHFRTSESRRVFRMRPKNRSSNCRQFDLQPGAFESFPYMLLVSALRPFLPFNFDSYEKQVAVAAIKPGCSVRSTQPERRSLLILRLPQCTGAKMLAASFSTKHLNERSTCNGRDLRCRSAEATQHQQRQVPLPPGRPSSNSPRGLDLANSLNSQTAIWKHLRAFLWAHVPPLILEGFVHWALVLYMADTFGLYQMRGQRKALGKQLFPK